MIKIFIGYDPRETVAYHVCAHSILSRASIPVAITPIILKSLPEFTRPMENQSTEFSFSRFLVPHLSGYTGQSIFMDCDMIVRCDIAEIFNHVTLDKDVYVVKHDYTPKTGDKFLGNKQVNYPKKNWSSVIVFNNFTSPCKRLTPELVNNADASTLHQFKWTDENRIGELPKEWNHLVGEYDTNPDAKIVHYTLGTPCFAGYENQEYGDEWRQEREAMLYAKN